MENINKKRIPLNGAFELTARCNLNCKMCLIRIDNQRMAELGGRERTTEEWIQMAQQVQQAGTIGLLLTGGEPMLRPDFIDIYKAVVQMGFILTLYTNATLVTDEIMDVLKEYPPHEIGITIYGASPKTYEKVCGNANAYYKMLEGVDRLIQLPSQIKFRTTIIQDNLGDLDKISDWVNGLGIDTDFSISRVVTKPVRGGIADVESCRLTPEQNAKLLEKKLTYYLVKPFSEIYHDIPMAPENETNRYQSTGEINRDMEDNSSEENISLYGCSAGMNSYTITWDGKLVGCQLLGDCWTHPFEEGFIKAWEDYPQQVKIPKQNDLCVGCKIQCSACPATRLAETGALNGFSEYLCRDSKLAYEMNHRLISKLKEIIAERSYEFESLRKTSNPI